MLGKRRGKKATMGYPRCPKKGRKKTGNRATVGPFRTRSKKHKMEVDEEPRNLKLFVIRIRCGGQ